MYEAQRKEYMWSTEFFYILMIMVNINYGKDVYEL